MSQSLSLNERINLRQQHAQGHATPTPPALPAPVALQPAPPAAPFPGTIRKGAVLGAPNSVLPDGTKLGPSGRALKGQDTPTTRAADAKPAPVKAVEAPRGWTHVEGDDDDADADDDREAPARIEFGDLKGPRQLSEQDTRTAAEALDIAREVMGRLSDNEHEGDEFGLVAAVLAEKVARFEQLLARLSVNPAPAPVAKATPGLPAVDPFSRLKRVEVAQTEGPKRGICSWLRR